MNNILIVEDDDTIILGLKVFLEKNHFNSVVANSVGEAKAVFHTDIDLILLDLNLPDGSGYDFCRYIKSKKDIPVIFLTVRDEEREMIKGLDMGADDYITKPFKLSILLSRINAVLRRVAKQQREEDRLHCKGIEIIKSQTKVYKNEREIPLTAGEYNLLLLMMENKNHTLTRSVLLEKLWDIDGEFVNDNTLSVAIKRLREKLEEPTIIRTVRGIGYRMEEENE